MTEQRKHIQKPRLLSFGEVLWDLIEGRAHIGGAAFNLAAHARRCGIDTCLLTAIGGDELGRNVLREVERLSVGAKYIQTDARHPTGTVTVRLTAGQPAYDIKRNVAWDFIDSAKAFTSGLAAERFDVICFGTLAQRSTLSAASLLNLLDTLKNVPAFFDVNLRQDFYCREIIVAGLRRATILKLNDSEVALLSALLYGRAMPDADFCGALQGDFPVSVILVTRGAEGCLVAEGGKATVLPGHSVMVADTVGAGDAFSAAFLAGWLNGKPAVESAKMGNLLGAFVASRNGAIPDYDDTTMRSLGLIYNTGGDIR